MKENRTVNRILAILELISQHEEGLTLGDIYRALDIPKATAYDFLQTLYAADAIYYKDPRLKNYVIGSKMFAIGSVYTKNSNIIEAGQHELRNFAQEHGRTVFIAKRVDGKMVYVYKYQPANSRILTPQEIGSISTDFVNDPVGRCFAAFDKKIQNAGLPNLDMIQKDRFVLSAVGDNGHICTIAIPVWNFENRVCGVVVAMDLTDSTCSRDGIAKDFLKIAEMISKRLGYLGKFYD